MDDELMTEGRKVLTPIQFLKLREIQRLDKEVKQLTAEASQLLDQANVKMDCCHLLFRALKEEVEKSDAAESGETGETPKGPQARPKAEAEDSTGRVTVPDACGSGPRQ